MNAGVVKSRYKKSELDKAIKQYKETALPAISSHEGARSAFLLLNRETGDALSIAIYETDASAKAFAPKAEKLIASFEPFVDSAVQPKRELYEIAASTQNEAKASGEFIQIFDVDRGLVKKVHMVYDQVQLMTQLGMAPAPPQQAIKTGR